MSEISAATNTAPPKLDNILRGWAGMMERGSVDLDDLPFIAPKLLEAATLLSELERVGKERDHYLKIVNLNAASCREMSAKRNAAEARALKAEKELEQRERVIAGLNKQLTEQFELSTKYVGKATKAQALVAEAVRVCEPFAAEASQWADSVPDDHLRAARAFIDCAKES